MSENHFPIWWPWLVVHIFTRCGHQWWIIFDIAYCSIKRKRCFSFSHSLSLSLSLPHTYTQNHTHIHTSLYSKTHMHETTHSCNLLAHPPTNLQTFSHTQTHRYSCAFVRFKEGALCCEHNIYSCFHTHTHTHTHVCAHIYTHKGTRACAHTHTQSSVP